MRPYLALVRMAFQRQLAYRFANVSGLLTNAFFGLLRASVLVALYGSRDSVQGFSLPAAVTYTGLTQAVLACIALFGWWDLMRTIRSGEVAADLSRPVDFYWYWAAQDVGRAVAQLVVRGMPILLAYALVYRITLPPTPRHWLALAAAMPLALSISFSWRFLVSLAAFWTPDAMGIGRAAWTVSIFFSGFLMPLAFFPPAAASLLRLTPFSAMINTLMEIYVGRLDGMELLAMLAVQAGWAVALYLLAQLVLRAGVRRLVIQGG